MARDLPTGHLTCTINPATLAILQEMGDRETGPDPPEGEAKQVHSTCIGDGEKKARPLSRGLKRTHSEKEFVGSSSKAGTSQLPWGVPRSKGTMTRATVTPPAGHDEVTALPGGCSGPLQAEAGQMLTGSCFPQLPLNLSCKLPSAS